MRRGKPQQQIYKPGSGPLRRTPQNIGSTESDTKILYSSKQGVYENRHKQKSEGSSPREPNLAADTAACKLGDMASQDDIKANEQRKNKKPDQNFYTPKAISQLPESTDILSSVDNKNLVKTTYNSKNEELNGSYNAHSEAKRYSHQWKSNDVNDYWPNHHHASNRHGSEPCAVPSNGGWNRGTRDTRSVEPSVNYRSYGGEKHYTKPPTGRRHSSVGIDQEKWHRNFETLPPRLQKKFLEDNKLDSAYGFIGSHSEGNWDGNSLVFQGTSQLPQHKYPPKQNFLHKQPFNMPMDVQHQKLSSANKLHQHHMPNNYQHMYYTLPHKGRGRVRQHEDYENQSLGRMYRSTTPEHVASRSPCNSRPSTPINRSSSRPQTPVQFNNRSTEWDRNKRTEHRDHKNATLDKGSNAEDSKTPPRAFRESLEAQLSPVSPPTPEKPIIASMVPVNDQLLDWSEEVDLEVRLETEASDALTRSSSVTSLVEANQTALSQGSKKQNKRKHRRIRRRNNSKLRDSSPYNNKNSNDNNNCNNPNSNKDVFKVPDNRAKWRQTARDSGNRSRNVSRESSYDRSHNEPPENWREEILRSRHNSEHEREREGSKEPEHKKGGLIILPAKEVDRLGPPVLYVDRPKYPTVQQKKSLFDPNNPKKPIIVKANSSRVGTPGYSESTKGGGSQMLQYTTDQFGNQVPVWYDENSDGYKLCHYSALIRDIQKADFELQCIHSDSILVNWTHIANLRRFLMDSLQYLLRKDLKFCESGNVEQHFWKILFHNIIETMRHTIGTDPNNKTQYKDYVLWIIDEGTKYFEGLLNILEETYGFKLTDYLGDNNLTPKKGLGYIGLALISAQKLFLCLGDLARYREQVNETSNFGKCRQWYIKAHEINPKNGRPYNQLAVVAVNSKRKLDAVYCYMRSLMSSHPVQSARENLISVFDENRKKYEQGERKRREERLEKARQHMKEKESESAAPPGSLRREIWIHPDGGRRVHRTTSAIQETKPVDSEEEDLATMSCADVNKRFVTSYLHVHGKLITKIGMETFQESALQMLKEFRTLLQHTPIPLNSNRLLQLLALNMYAIESTQLKDPQLQEQKRYRSELQERALVISLQMFNLILERCVSLFHDHIRINPDSLTKLTHNSIPQDFHTLLPAVKIWCDWMLCHSGVWNPPPSMHDYRVGPAGDAWSRLASLMNLLEKLDHSIAALFSREIQDGYEMVRLPEDVALHGFIPLMYNEHEPTYALKEIEPEIAQLALRLSKVLFFGTTFLCGIDPPVLKLELDNDFSEYISVVSTSSANNASPSPTELINEDVVVESFSEDEDDEKPPPADENASSDVNPLLRRKVELEKRQRSHELHRQRVQKILQQSVVTVHIEIRPKILVPDTNCFIDHLSMIQSITAAHVYTLMVPLVVLNELEGLSRGGKYPTPLPRMSMDPQHILKVADASKRALEYLGNRQNNIKCVTAKGTTLTTFAFTSEEDSDNDSTLRNDDKILATCLMLCKNNKDQLAEGEPKKLHREVVLLTEDRNLRVKALARDLPVRDLPGFLQWAGLG